MLINNQIIDAILRLFAFFVVITFAVIFTISPMNGEDYAFTRILEHESVLARVNWIFTRSREQIVGWNARFGEQLAIIWLNVPKIYFILVATTTFVALSFLVGTIVTGSGSLIYITCISICSMFAIWPGMEMFFWGTVNAGYLQPIVLTLVCIYLYRSDEAINNLVKSKLLLISAALVSFLAGISFENTPIAVIFYMAVSLFIVKTKTSNRLALLPMLTMAMGWLILLNAPSTLHRRNYYNDLYGVHEYSFGYLVGRITDVAQVFFNTSVILFFLALISFIYIYFHAKDKKRILLTIITALLVVSSVVAAPYTEPRSFALAWALMFSLIMAAISIVTEKLYWVKQLVLPVCALLFLFPLKTMAIYSDFAEKLDQRDFYIKSRINTQECISGIGIKSIQTNYPRRYLNNRDDWYYGNLEFISKYYKCNIIIEKS